MRTRLHCKEHQLAYLEKYPLRRHCFLSLAPGGCPNRLPLALARSIPALVFSDSRREYWLAIQPLIVIISSRTSGLTVAVHAIGESTKWRLLKTICGMPLGFAAGIWSHNQRRQLRHRPLVCKVHLSLGHLGQSKCSSSLSETRGAVRSRSWRI